MARRFAAVVLFAALMASAGCFWMARDPITGRYGGTVVPYTAHAHLPNLTFSPVRGGNAKIVVAPCISGSPSADISPADCICASVAIENLGYEWTSGPAEVLFVLDGAPVEGWFIPDPVRPGEIVERSGVSFGPLAPGPHLLRVTIDPGKQIAESDETDNEVTASFRVSPASS